MLKIKVLISGVVIQVAVFIFFVCVISLFAVGFGNIKSGMYILLLEIVSYVSVIISSFITARIAWEKGCVYGVIIATAFFVLRLLAAVLMSTELEIGAIVTKLFLLILSGFLSGALGVSGNKNKSYFT